MKIPVALLVTSFLAVQFQQNYGAEIRDEIFKGSPARRGQFPYQAFILSRNETSPPNSYYACGGSLISTSYVLTAGHCIYKYYQSIIFLGVISSTDLAPKGSFMDTVLVEDNGVVHPDYDPEVSLVNDIAILKLNKQVTPSNYIKTIALPRYSWKAVDYFKDKYVMVSGFGNKYEGDKSQATLDYTKQIVLGQDDCKSVYSGVTDSMICTEKQKINAGPCKGDSGGPLTVSVNNVPYLIGAVSFGELGGCNDTKPESYTNVAYFLPFIKQVTGLSYKN